MTNITDRNNQTPKKMVGVLIEKVQCIALNRPEPMKDASEDEQLVDFVVASKKDTAQNKKSKTEREEQLRKLMDDEGMSSTLCART